jgi:uncharacterized protein (TIGR02145 family)
MQSIVNIKKEVKNMKTINLLIVCFVILSLQTKAQTLTDVDGNVYETVKIGNQVWMAENLKVTHYSNGKPIPLVTDNGLWYALTTPACCYYNNDKNNIAIYGYLYNWYAVSDNNNICPKGWHIPSDEEWMELATYLGGAREAGGRMKEVGTKHWAEPNDGATNESGFTALPGGLRGNGGAFYSMDIDGGMGAWWSSTEEDNKEYAWCILSIRAMIIKDKVHSKADGLSIRCIKDK